MNSEVDISQLAFRGQHVPGRRIAVRRHLLGRYLLPAAIAAAFLALVSWAAWDWFVPSRKVTVMPVLATRSAVGQAGTPLFSAAGWVEARPAPVVVTALAEGVIKGLEVVEDQAVEAEQAVAYLFDEDARLALKQAEADVEVKQAELSRARAVLAAARTNVEEPVHLEAAVAEAESLLAAAETELADLPFQIRTAESRQRLARQDLDRKNVAGAVVPGREIQRAETELEKATAGLEQLQARRTPLEGQRDALKRKRNALDKQLTLRTEETRALREAGAKVEAAEAHLKQARLAVETAELRMQRMTVRAPVAGRVLDLVARQGTRVAGMSAASGQQASTVVTLYDPKRLQVRADVRLEDLSQVIFDGQPVRIETDAIDHPLDGKVLFATSSADVQKNTLEVKVEVIDPPSLLKPEMLVQVTFLAAATAGEDTPQERLRLYVPKRLVERSEEEAYVWVADQTAAVARRQAVETGGVGQGDLVEVLKGLTPASRLIVGGREGLEDGQRIKVTGEDATLGS